MSASASSSATSGKTAAELLARPAQYIAGVGPQRAELLAKLDLHTARDVLFFFPRDYQDMSVLRRIGELVEGELCGVCGVIEEIDIRTTSPGRSVLGVLVRQDREYLRAIWFNQPYVRDRLERGRRVLVQGKPKLNGLRWEMAHPRIEQLDDEEEVAGGTILPVYSLTEGIHQGQMRRIVQAVVREFAPVVDEVFPEEFLREKNLLPIREALPEMHAPRDAATLMRARRRFVYQELLVLQLAVAMRRRGLTTERRAAPLPVSAKIDARVRRLLPFTLTPDQDRAIAEVTADMARVWPMNRLLQGEVGSGKTVVAVYAMLLAVAHGEQAVMMAPTEVLARQHVLVLRDLLREGRVRIGLLSGSLTAAERADTLGRIAAGEVDIVVGTQAIIESEAKFARLGLVIIDEQHKFGVRQRARLRDSARDDAPAEGRARHDPHYLVMTATPIPRTVTMTLFGDLDVSTIRECPSGRQPVYTYIAGEDRRGRWWEFFRKKLREGRQGYVVAPLVEESERLNVPTVEETFEKLANGELAEFRIDLIHGRLSPADKEAAMEAFRQGRTQVLVATSVVEVGIDVPNATVMTIEGAERFGLAQLHQLRGRVSRGAHPGYVCAFADPQTEGARKRLVAFEETTDGFRLAEIDFALRGPGDLFGTRQHGLPPLRVADLTQDAAVLEEARRDAQALIAREAGLDSPPLALLRRMVVNRYGRALELVDVG
jgi:ATP-dependent DNA helicase RecG